jgi:hypothetical protein
MPSRARLSRGQGEEAEREDELGVLAAGQGISGVLSRE